MNQGRPSIVGGTTAAALGDSIIARGYAVQVGDKTTDSSSWPEWEEFRSSWEDLATDKWMRDGNTYRKRRYGRFSVKSDSLELTPMEYGPFYQSETINGYAGGILRHFEPLKAEVRDGGILSNLIIHDFNIVRRFEVSDGWWDIQVHQIRIEGQTGRSSAPTPEGLHRDGHDFLSIHLIGRSNVSGGESIIADGSEREIQRVLLEKPLDTLYLDDRSVFHYVNPIEKMDSSKPGFRDVLVLDFDFRNS